jgi:prevent-host-death family protein
MEMINVDDAQIQLSRLVDQAIAGEDVIVGRNGEPLARITALKVAKRPIIFGRLAGKFEVPDDFDAPLPDEVIAAFEGR